MRSLFLPCIAALGLGLSVVLVAAAAGSLPWLGLGVFTLVCGTRDLLRLVDIRFGRVVADIAECLLYAAVWLVLSAADPFRPKQDD